MYKINTVKATASKSQGPNLYEVLAEWKQDCDAVESRAKGSENVQPTSAYPDVTPDSNGILTCLDWT